MLAQRDGKHHHVISITIHRSSYLLLHIGYPNKGVTAASLANINSPHHQLHFCAVLISEAAFMIVDTTVRPTSGDLNA
jgi:hypothetical protein